MEKLATLPMKTNPKVCNKSNELFDVLYTHLGDKMNLARIRLMIFLIGAMCKVQTVGFQKLSCAFDNSADSLSNMRRIQRFMAMYALDFSLIAKIVFKLLPHKGPYTLSMDRTNWQFGKFDINALVLGITYKGVAFPLLFKLLPKRGNSNTSERIQLMDQYIKLFGIATIDSLVADREFVGKQWLHYLNINRIPYHLRIRENFWVINPRTSEKIKAQRMFSHLKMNEQTFLYKIYYVNDELCYLSAGRFKNQEGKLELQILVSFNNPHKAINSYKDRWQIETCFRAMKSSGFNIEQTHLKKIERVERLFAVMMIAFLWAYLVGIYKHTHCKAIRILNNGRRAKSFFKYGLEEIAEVLLNYNKNMKFDIFQILSCT